jgi:heme-binding protein
MSSKRFPAAGGFLAVILIGMQFIQPERTNPPSDPNASFEALAKPSPEIAAGLKRACSDCHSHETVWPWYSRIAPVSWIVAQDVRDGRAHLNFSNWNQPAAEAVGEAEQPGLPEMCEEVRSGEMPPRSYRLLHPQARLSQPEISAICSARTARN